MYACEPCRFLSEKLALDQWQHANPCVRDEGRCAGTDVALQWDDGVLKTKPTVELHIMATVFHYGQCLFEGLKVGHRCS